MRVPIYNEGEMEKTKLQTPRECSVLKRERERARKRYLADTVQRATSGSKISEYKRHKWPTRTMGGVAAQPGPWKISCD